MSSAKQTAGISREAASAARSVAAEQEFRALLDAAVDGIIVIDHQGLIEEFSLAAERLFGYMAEEVIGQNVSVLMPAPYQASHDRYMQHFAETGEQRIIGVGREVRASRKDGSHFPCDLAVGRVSGVDPPRFVGIIRDISARKLAAEKLRRSESELRLAQELANLGNYVVHLDASEPDYFSPQMFRILGVEVGSRTGTLAEYLEQWVQPADTDRVREAFEEMESGSGALDVEYRVTLGDGSTKHLHHIAQTIYDERRQPVKHIGTVHDVTDRRYAEDEARQLQDRLTHFARLSTMGEMAAGLAHEINQPLSAIATYAQACQRMLKLPEHDPDDILAALGQINAQALRAGEVIRRLRLFVKNREVKREPVDCTRLLDDLRTLAETDARLHSVRLRIESEDEMPMVYADPIQLQQVILNLVRNAIDAMAELPEHRREVVLSTCETADGEVEITVADHGTGLAPDATEHLFNPFFTTKPGGTGLGLAISRSIVRAHGGRLWHTPNAGTGARFHFTLPVTPASTGSSDE